MSGVSAVAFFLFAYFYSLVLNVSCAGGTLYIFFLLILNRFFRLFSIPMQSVCTATDNRHWLLDCGGVSLHLFYDWKQGRETKNCVLYHGVCAHTTL